MTQRQARIFIFGALGYFKLALLNDLRLMSYQLALHVHATLTYVVPNHILFYSALPLY